MATNWKKKYEDVSNKYEAEAGILRDIGQQLEQKCDGLIEKNGELTQKLMSAREEMQGRMHAQRISDLAVLLLLITVGLLAWLSFHYHGVAETALTVQLETQSIPKGNLKPMVIALPSKTAKPQKLSASERKFLKKGREEVEHMKKEDPAPMALKSEDESGTIENGGVPVRDSGCPKGTAPVPDGCAAL